MDGLGRMKLATALSGALLGLFYLWMWWQEHRASRRPKASQTGDEPGTTSDD